jgi:hypothetical protein
MTVLRYPYYLPMNPCCNSGCDPCGNPQATLTRQSDSIIYTGPNLPCSGIDNGDTLTVVIQKIEELLCGITTTTTTTVIT